MTGTDDETDWRQQLPTWVREDRPLDESGWTNEFRMTFVVDYLEQHANERKLRLFASACCRRVWDLLSVPAAQRIVELSDALADGADASAELRALHESSDFVELDALAQEDAPRADVRISACGLDALRCARSLAARDGFDLYLIVQNTSRDLTKDFVRSSWNYQIGRSPGPDAAEFAFKERLLHDIFGNPFRPVSFNPAWRTDTAVSLARTMYDSREFGAMPILADALQDAGCEDEQVLHHCRDANQVHVRGCWVCDLVLGKD